MKIKKNLGTIIVIAIVSLLIVFTMLVDSGKENPNNNPSTSINTSLLSTEMKEWYDTTHKDEYVVTVIGLSYCGYCAQYKPIIEEITDDENIKLYYFDYDTIAESAPEDANALENTYNLESYTGSSPYTFITKNGEFIGDTVGYMDKETAITFLSSLGVID